MPYDSFLIDPFLLFLTGLGAGWLAVRLPIARRSPFLKGTVVVTLLVYWGTSISRYFDLEWTRWLWEMCGSASGRDWMLNSGIFHFEFKNPGWLTHVLSALIFATYPLYLLVGLALGTPRLKLGLELGLPRWHGRAGRQEVWYGTATDPATGNALWLHAETVAPPASPPYAHGWAAFFPHDGPPVLSHFGPHAHTPGPHWFATDDATLSATAWQGQTPRIIWDLQQKLGAPPLLPFPRWLWEMEVLPGTMAVLDPQAQWSGHLTVDGVAIPFAGNAGLARIYGHGSAARWTWLHADLGEGAVLEVVSAVSMRPGLARLRPLAFVRLRWQGQDWPRWPLVAALTAFRCDPALPQWTLTGQVGAQRLHATVTLPPERCVVVPYRDPDGRTATCTNSERADVRVEVSRREGGAWRVVKAWDLQGTGHAEVGVRP